MIIAIDGPSGTGKSTVARAVASKLGFTFFDTGAMYRSFAWYIRHLKIDPSNEEMVCLQLSSFQFEIIPGKDGMRTYLVGDTDVTDKIRLEEIGTYASLVAVYPQVRKAMVEMQRAFGSRCDAVFEGRDMGTVVFPQAEVKIFLTADETVRAQRRYLELVEKNPQMADSLSVEQILAEMQKRDDNDANRTISPLKQAPDAILIDTSFSSIDEVVSKIVALVEKEAPTATPRRFVYRLCRGVISFFTKLFFRLRVYGEEHVHVNAGIIIANHTSYLDPPVLAVAYPGEVHFLARETLFRVPVLGKIIRALNTHPVANNAGDLHILRQMVGLLNSGKKLILFPEGRRSTDGQLLPFARGFAFLAKKTKCTIFPAYIEGAYRAWPSSRSIPIPFCKITIVFGSPLAWKEGESEEEFIERCSSAIARLHTWLSEGAHGNPP